MYLSEFKVGYDADHYVVDDKGTPFKIDKQQWFWYPHLYLMKNKPPREPEDDAFNVLPTCFADRNSEIQMLLSLPQNMSGLTVLTDDPQLIKHWHALRKRESVVTHKFEVRTRSLIV